MSKRLTGLNPLAYLGVEPLMPPNMFMFTTSPTSSDSRNFNIGDFWVNTVTEQLWVLVNLAGGVATWITPNGSAAVNFVTDSGTATPSGGVININGDGLNILTSGVGNTITIRENPDPTFGNVTLTGITFTGLTGGVLVSNNSGVISEVATTNHSLLIGNASSTISSLGVATNGAIPIGSTGADPVLATITAGSGVTVTNGAGSITIAATGSGGSVTSISAGTGITLTPNPITTTGTVALTVPVVVANGGTGDTSFTAYSVITGGTTSTGALQNVSGVGSAGQVLTSNGAGTLPTWQTGSVPQSVSVTLTSAQVKSLQATPHLLLAAQGANTIINPLSFVTFLSYGGSNVFVTPASGGSTIFAYFTNATGTANNTISAVFTQSSYVQAASNYQLVPPTGSNPGTLVANCVNQPIYIAMPTGASGEITGNAANDNTITVKMIYELITVPL